MNYIKERFKILMNGRNGIDEFCRFLFLVWAACAVMSAVFPRWIGIIGPIMGSICRIIGFMALVLFLIRAFSRNTAQRSVENTLFLQWFSKQKQKYEAYKGRRALSKEYRFYKCPNCGTYVRVPKGKGKIHINCKCGYILYRKS